MTARLARCLLLALFTWIPPALAAPPADQASREVWRARLDAARTRQIERLKAYAEAGRFPRNHRIFGRVPIFVDDDGATCAVAHLMTLDGRGAAVKAISAADNYIYVEDARAGPLVDWVLFSGLLIEEAALIQPGYTRWRGGRGPLDAAGPPRTADWNRPEHARVPEDGRLRAHFARVVEQLERHRARAIEAALDRAWPTIMSGRAPVLP